MIDEPLISYYYSFVDSPGHFRVGRKFYLRMIHRFYELCQVKMILAKKLKHIQFALIF